MDNASYVAISVARYISQRPSRFRQKLVAIDGLGASGKSMFAQHLARELDNAIVIHVDSFYKPSYLRTLTVDSPVSQDFDWNRLESQVFDAVTHGTQIFYEHFNYRKDVITRQVKVHPDRMVIIEGIYATQERFRGLYDYTIWVEAPREQRVKNMVAREGERVARQWQERWMKKEDAYYTMLQPYLYADLVVRPRLK